MIFPAIKQKHRIYRISAKLIAAVAPQGGDSRSERELLEDGEIDRDISIMSKL